MTREDLYKYLSIEQVLLNYGIEAEANGNLECPFHKDCKTGMQLYKELNAIACTRINCEQYRKVYNAFDLLQELESCNKREALIYGEGLLLEELVNLRKLQAGTKPQKKAEKKAKQLSEGGLLFKEKLEDYLEEKGSMEFMQKELYFGLRMNQHTLKNYLKILQDLGEIEVIGGNRYRGGYLYKYEPKD